MLSLFIFAVIAAIISIALLIIAIFMSGAVEPKVLNEIKKEYVEKKLDMDNLIKVIRDTCSKFDDYDPEELYKLVATAIRKRLEGNMNWSLYIRETRGN